jgi:surface carbohydrate biosynthesis protein (TIGR04326 family)
VTTVFLRTGPEESAVDGAIIDWQSYDQHAGRLSVPRYLEQHSDRLRAKYLAFIHDLGETRIGSKRLVEHLALDGEFSFWWMNQVAEKSPFKSPRIYDCLRLLALEEILQAQRPSRLRCSTGDPLLAQSLQRLCRNLGIVFSNAALEKNALPLGARRAYDALPYALQGLLSLRHALKRWRLRALHPRRSAPWFSGPDAVFFCSYFFNLDQTKGAAGHFHSRQWEDLPQHLHRAGKQANWLHHLVLSPAMPDVATAAASAAAFNRRAAEEGCHRFVDSFLSVHVIAAALKNWVRLNVAGWRLRGIEQAFSPDGSAAWLWPLLQKDWGMSLTGSAAMSNCLWVELFDAALASLPRQETGFYLWENQGWEAALLRAWRKHGHGELIGVPHATTVYWHMNNFDDARTLAGDPVCPKPLPDFLAVNGPMAERVLLGAGDSAARMLPVEALRFQYLANRAPRPASATKSDAPRKILVLGDFTYRQTVKMLECMRAALGGGAGTPSITLKPHPVCKIDQADCPGLQFDLTDRPLADIMHDFDLAFSSNTSSAGLDALLAGLPVVVFLDDCDFNHSPLRGVEGVRFAGTPEELAAALEQSSGPRAVPNAAEFFRLDSKLGGWQKIMTKSGSMQ